MTRIDFYILQGSAGDDRWHFACRLIEKAFHQQHRILVALDSAEDAVAFDQLLWTFKPESFIPHRIADPSISSASDNPVLISATPPATLLFPAPRSLLVNLSQQIPEAFRQFERLAEVVIQDKGVLKNTREHYDFYRKQGYSIDHRKIGSELGSDGR